MSNPPSAPFDQPLVTDLDRVCPEPKMKAPRLKIYVTRRHKSHSGYGTFQIDHYLANGSGNVIDKEMTTRMTLLSVDVLVKELTAKYQKVGIYNDVVYSEEKLVTSRVHAFDFKQGSNT